MNAYRTQRAAGARRGRRQADSPTRQERLHLRADEEALRLQRRHDRFVRQDQDAQWRKARAERYVHKQAWRALSRAEKRKRLTEHAQQEQAWRQTRLARYQQLERRPMQDEQWREARTGLRQRRAALFTAAQQPSVWLAVLVVVDNCTRRCLGLPLFTAGVHVTSDMVVEALRPLIPPSVAFVISDNGSQFTAHPFAGLADALNFVHVRIAPYRARTNGIAERFVRTLKAWLAHHDWTAPEEVVALLTEFERFYNARPHQGRELAGRSPDTYTHDLLSCATC